MADETIENGNSQNAEEIEETPETLENTPEESEEEPEEATDDDSEDVRSIKERNRQLFERAKKAEQEAKRLRDSQKPTVKTQVKTQETPKDPAEVARQIYREERERETLEQLELPDDLKQEVKDLAQLKGISVREAAKLPYIQSRKEEVEREERVRSATPSRKNKGSYVSSIDPSKPLNPGDFDFNTEEGIKAWKEAKAARDRHLASQ